VTWGVKLSDVTIQWRGSEDPVLSGINLDLSFDGSFNRLPIMGRSGTGKSTLMYILAAMKWPDKGLVSWTLPNGDTLEWHGHMQDKTSLADWHELRSQHFGFAFQGSALLPYLSVLQNLTFPLEQKGMSKAECLERANSALLDVLIETEGETPSQFVNRYPHELSGGQRQRVALAQAFISSPTVLFADEPTGALDKVTRKEIMLLLTDWLEKGNGDRALIWVTHHHNDPVDNNASNFLEVNHLGCQLKCVETEYASSRS
jgi:putative ABC transport system ATP-binding protein